MISRPDKHQALEFGLALISPLLVVDCAKIAAGEAPAVYSQCGDIGAKQAVVWARCNNKFDSRPIIELSTLQDFGGQNTAKEVRRREEQEVSADTDYTGSVVFRGLKPNQTYYYRARCRVKDAASGLRRCGDDEGIVKGKPPACFDLQSLLVQFDACEHPAQRIENGTPLGTPADPASSSAHSGFSE
ncbi:MAG: PhoD-like phosphatase N-terminal domain-containing protein [Gammaproteobacteria bacterium]